MKRIKLKKRIVIPIVLCTAVVLIVSILLNCLFVVNVGYSEALFIETCLCAGVPSPTDVHIPGEGYINHYHDESAKSEVTVEFDGETYTGEYSHSDVNLPYTYNLHEYKVKKDGYTIRFSINSKTGKLVEFMDLHTTNNREINKDEARKIADNFAAKYINVSDYEVYSYSTVYVYTKDVAGYGTAEILRIGVNPDGEIDEFEAQSIGDFNYVKKVKYDEDKLEKVITNKVNKVYGSENWTDLKLGGVKLVKVGKWKYGFWCQATVYTNSDSHSLRFIVK